MSGPHAEDYGVPELDCDGTVHYVPVGSDIEDVEEWLRGQPPRGFANERWPWTKPPGFVGDNDPYKGEG